MKPIKARPSRGLPQGATVHIADNSGARIVKIITVKGYKTRTRKKQRAAVADLCTCNVIAGKPDMRHKVIPVVIIRQKQGYKRTDGTTVKFEDNAGVVLRDVKLGMPKGTVIKGPIAKEVALRWSQLAKIASIVL
ncbi:50S ribosomal protein L14 [Candidatus Woesearchaeota archaeon]|jgi:large subunit ribosomal protein L14|nr:50S ribosomal protein L14 [Candidatus Woesearchaeota archaeon]MBT4114758.1 50S ribosomal protein L14 [Candidatus Woesearchaeota archaeon]MBT4248131.1 50S ribosomal protein L14 [Candidatus Woesearchaeota archaeon]